MGEHVEVLPVEARHTSLVASISGLDEAEPGLGIRPVDVGYELEAIVGRSEMPFDPVAGVGLPDVQDTPNRGVHVRRPERGAVDLQVIEVPVRSRAEREERRGRRMAASRDSRTGAGLPIASTTYMRSSAGPGAIVPGARAIHTVSGSRNAASAGSCANSRNRVPRPRVIGSRCAATPHSSRSRGPPSGPSPRVTWIHSRQSAR